MEFFLIGYLALFWTIWFHEVAHSYMYKKYGCKKESFLKVHVPLYLFFSTPMPVDVKKAGELTKKQVFNVSIAGVFINMILGIISIMPLTFVTISNKAGLIFLYFFTAFNLTEAATYLVINNIFLASDMKGVADYNQGYRVIAFVIGIFVIAAIVYLISIAPTAIVNPLLIWSILIALSMSGGRIFFEIKNKKQSN